MFSSIFFAHLFQARFRTSVVFLLESRRTTLPSCSSSTSGHTRSRRPWQMDNYGYQPLVCLHSEALLGNNALGGYRARHRVSPCEMICEHRILRGAWGGASVVRNSSL